MQIKTYIDEAKNVSDNKLKKMYNINPAMLYWFNFHIGLVLYPQQRRDLHLSRQLLGC